MGWRMKDFTYYDFAETSLHVDSCDWLRDTGLRETQWILDTEWLLTQITSVTFKEWIGE